MIIGILVVGVGVILLEFDVVVIPHPGTVKKDVAQSVTSCLFPMTGNVVHDTALDIQGGRLIGVGLGVETDVVEFTQPGIEKNEVAQSVGNCLFLNIISGQETVLVIQGGRLVGVVVGKEVVLPQPNIMDVEVAQSVLSCLRPITGNVVQDDIVVMHVFTLVVIIGGGGEVVELLVVTMSIGIEVFPKRGLVVTIGGLDVVRQLACVENMVKHSSDMQSTELLIHGSIEVVVINGGSEVVIGGSEVVVGVGSVVVKSHSPKVVIVTNPSISRS